MRPRLPGARLWWLLLRLHPRDFRRRHGVEVLAHLEEELRRLPSARARALYCVGASFDLARAALRLHLRSRRRRAGARRGTTSRLRAALAPLAIDLRHGLRALQKAPLHTAVVVATLAVSIGFDTSVFSVVDRVLLRPLPYREAERLVQISASLSHDGFETVKIAGEDFRQIRRASRAFQDVAAAADIRQNLTGLEPPLQVDVGWVSKNLFAVLGIEAERGRTFSAADPPGTALLSHEIWTAHFAADPEVVGRGIQLDGRPYTIVGVLPRGFRLQLPRFPQHIDIWKVPDDWWQNGDAWNASGSSYGIFRLIGRLAPEAPLQRAQDELVWIADTIRRQVPEYAASGLELSATPLLDAAVADLRPTLLLLLGAVSLVLLIACANVAGLMLVRARQRRSEIAVRRALGSSGAAAARLFLVESALLATGGAVLGAALAPLATATLLSLRADDLPRLDEIGLDTRVLLFAVAVGLVVTVLVGVAPALVAGRTDLDDDLRLIHRTRSTRTRGGRRWSHALVTSQISLSLVLLVGTGLLGDSLARLQRIDAGFDPDGVLTFSVSLPGTRYERPEGTNRFLRRLEERIEALPGVQSAGVVWPLPLSGHTWSGGYFAGAVAEGERRYAEYRLATPSYFDTVVTPIVDGRTFSSGDQRHVAVVNRRLAERAWPGEPAVGRTLHVDPWGGGSEPFEVVGVAENARFDSLRSKPVETVYFDASGWSWTDWEVDFVVRAVAVDPSSLVPAIRAQLHELDPEVPLARPRLMRSEVEEELSDNRFALSLIGLFGIVAAGLAVLGLYGVLSTTVDRRRQELGIRIALGSRRGAILVRVLAHGLGLAAAGLGLGLTAAIWLSPLLRSLLFEVRPHDPRIFLATALLLAVVASVASLVPAWRATRLDPAEILRGE